ncbi:MAG: Rne/Rng family ribonuclease [Microbacteriaceae bacterium]|nr:Rne/Rng family ribonuclease [Microbacteriaceae bacterium]
MVEKNLDKETIALDKELDPTAVSPATDEDKKEAEETVTTWVSPLTPVFLAPDLPPSFFEERYDRFNREPRENRNSSEPRNTRDNSRGRGKKQAEEEEFEAGGVIITEQVNEPQRLKGSTRLEAKKQRRRDGRDTNRRRGIITESEFLARREAVDRQMIVRQSISRTEIGVLEDGVLVEHYVAKETNESLIGNVYLGRVQNVLPSMEAAFVDIGRGRNAVLYSGEVDWDAQDGDNQPRRIELALKTGDSVLVQVTKDPVGHKGARLTSQVSLPGRYLVFVPGGGANGISRKLPDNERVRLKKILKEILPENAGVIVRTAAEGATQEQLTQDVNRLNQQWLSIQEKTAKENPPTLLHSEPDLLIKILRDVFNEDFGKLVVSGEVAFKQISEYISNVVPDLADRLEKYEGSKDIFAEFRVSEQIDKALDRKVWLPSGGSLIIDRTEAMTVIDVNTGKFVGSGGNLEETVTKNNLEAAEEIVRQLRLRDIGGIIVIDFIDMVLESNRDLVLRRLVECLSRDRTKHQVAEVTSLGLVQMTRKKLGVGLAESLSEKIDSTEAPTKQDAPTKRRTAKQSKNVTHQLTEDVTNSVAKIAAATISASESGEHELGEGSVSEDHDHHGKQAAKSTFFDIDFEGQQAVKPHVSQEEAEKLLGSVLDALPDGNDTTKSL